MKAMRSFLKRLSFDLFMLGDRLGVHVLPKHYHTPIPDYRWLRQDRRLWTGRASLTGVHWDLDEHLRWIRGLYSPYYEPVSGAASGRSALRRFQSRGQDGLGYATHLSGSHPAAASGSLHPHSRYHPSLPPRSGCALELLGLAGDGAAAGAADSQSAPVRDGV